MIWSLKNWSVMMKWVSSTPPKYNCLFGSSKLSLNIKTRKRNEHLLIPYFSVNSYAKKSVVHIEEKIRPFRDTLGYICHTQKWIALTKMKEFLLINDDVCHLFSFCLKEPWILLIFLPYSLKFFCWLCEYVDNKIFASIILSGKEWLLYMEILCKIL